MKTFDAYYITRILKAEIEDYNYEDSFDEYGIEFLTALRLAYKALKPLFGDIEFLYVAQYIETEMEEMLFTQEAIDLGIEEVKTFWNELS